MLSSESDIRDRFDMYRQDAEHYTQSNRERVVQFVETPTTSDFQETTQVIRPSFVPHAVVESGDELTRTRNQGQPNNVTKYSRVMTICLFINFVITLGAIVLSIITWTRLNSTRL